MRYEVDQVSEILKTYFSSNVPSVLIAKGLKTIETFLSEPCDDSDKRQMAVYPSDGEDSEASSSDGYIVILQLPGEQNPKAWNSAVYPIVRAFDPKKVGFITKMCTHSTWWPGEGDAGGGGSVVMFEMKFSRENSDDDIEY